MKRNVVALDLGDNGSSFLAANLTAAADRHAVNGSRATADDLMRLVAQIDGRDSRPVAVIDPEDREQVERLLSLLADALNWGPHNMQRESYREPMQAALREFANPTPPRPEEPTGLGAVVEDEGGVQYVLANPRGVAKWIPRDAGADHIAGPWRYWEQIAAVRVLSEGVQA